MITPLIIVQISTSLIIVQISAPLIVQKLTPLIAQLPRGSRVKPISCFWRCCLLDRMIRQCWRVFSEDITLSNIYHHNLPHSHAEHIWSYIFYNFVQFGKMSAGHFVYVLVHALDPICIGAQLPKGSASPLYWLKATQMSLWSLPGCIFGLSRDTEADSKWHSASCCIDQPGRCKTMRVVAMYFCIFCIFEHVYFCIFCNLVFLYFCI